MFQTTPRLWRGNEGKDNYYAFGKRYFNDPEGFARECIIWQPGDSITDYQGEIMSALVGERRVCMRSCHGAGKTTMSAILVIWFALTRDALGYDWKVVTTASVNRQLSKYLWPEVHKWSRRLNWQRIHRAELKEGEEIHSMSIKLRHGQAFAVASNKSDLIEGAHADHILYIFDEAKVIPNPTWAAAEGALVQENALFLVISTPGEPNGRFYEIQTGAEGTESWWVRHVQIHEALAAGRVSQEWIDGRKREWGEESALYQNKVLGEFAYSDVTGLIPLAWVEAAMRRWKEKGLDKLEFEEIDTIGVDVARGGGDLSVIARRAGVYVATLEKWGDIDTMELAGRAAALLKFHGCAAWVDIVGMGAGVYDRLAEQFEDMIFPFHPQENTVYVDRTGLWEFVDTYSAAWWNLRELLDPKFGAELCLPPDNDLKADLTAAEWQVMSSGKIQVMRKEKVKEKLGRSPDSGDAVVMACWNPNSLMGMESA